MARNENLDKSKAQILFGKRVRKLRKARGLTQENLAEKIGKTVDTVSNIERGFTSTPIPTMELIAEALEVELQEFFIIRATGGHGEEGQEALDFVQGMLDRYGTAKTKEALLACEKLLAIGQT